jgi:hypothetical protein
MCEPIAGRGKSRKSPGIKIGIPAGRDLGPERRVFDTRGSDFQAYTEFTVWRGSNPGLSVGLHHRSPDLSFVCSPQP